MMIRSLDGMSFSVQPSFWVVIILAVVLLPLQWVAAWILAVTIHEFGHIYGIVLFHIPIYAVRVKCSGIYIQTAQMLLWQEVVIALMGPIIGGIPIVFARWLPHTAVCAMVLSVFNTLPFTCFDGGRVVFGILQMFLSSVNAHRSMRVLQIILFLLILFVGIAFKQSIVIVLIAGALLLRMILQLFLANAGNK